jgi:hypothetical protein
VISDELCFPYMAMPTMLLFNNLYLKDTDLEVFMFYYFVTRY